MAINEAAYQRLEAHGRRDGRITVEEMGRELPIEEMDPVEIAEVVDRLERAGIDVDVDAALLKPHPDRGRSGDAAGVVDIAHPAAPAVSVPGVRPSRPADIAGMGEPLHGHSGHGRKAPTWNHNGMDLLPIVCVGVVAIVMIVALG
ncbi:MAG TPA: RNA polymerase sigma factor region1.1 domain-containing protein [Azospirillum sp.]|nr:RNA polymerase sigma factor region1.1 domain-containing protein [Azospirillum sp.]